MLRLAAIRAARGAAASDGPDKIARVSEFIKHLIQKIGDSVPGGIVARACRRAGAASIRGERLEAAPVVIGEAGDAGTLFRGFAPLLHKNADGREPVPQRV